jgi:hypothetical protein
VIIPAFEIVAMIFAKSIRSALGAPASRRHGLAMAEIKTNETNGGIRKYVPARGLMLHTFLFFRPEGPSVNRPGRQAGMGG